MSTREPVAGTKFTIRRIHYASSNWRPPPAGKITSGNFSGDEVSVDVFAECPTVETVTKHCAKFVERGYGVACAQVEPIRIVFSEKKIEGDILHAPVVGNADHAVITGRNNNLKKKTLAELFGGKLLIEPKPQ